MPDQLTPFEHDMLDQPAALSNLIASTPTIGLDQFLCRHWDRVVLTGMGSSHFAAIPTWRAVTSAGRPCWLVDAGTLLDTPELVTHNTLIIATSQSGASGEVVEAVTRLRDRWSNRIGLIGITADETSPLASTADMTVPLHSGPEATVSTKSYLNTLGVHHRLAGLLLGHPDTRLDEDLRAARESVVATLQARQDAGTGSAMLATASAPRLVTVGKRDATATALYAALITKEAAKVPMEAFAGGQFRHGPFELAGEGMTVILYGAEARDDDDSLTRLAEDLLSVGTSVVLVGDVQVPGARTLAAGGPTTLQSLMTGAVVAQHLAVELAHANGVTPGEFVYGNKVTTAL